MERYVINNIGKKSEVVKYTPSNTYYIDSVYDKLVFRLDRVHKFKEGDVVNISKANDINNILTSSVVSLRKPIKVSFNIIGPRIIEIYWRYVDESNKWQYIRQVTNSEQTQIVYSTDINNSNGGQTALNYILSFRATGITTPLQTPTSITIEFKEINSKVWQHVILHEEILNDNTILSNVFETNVDDTFIMLSSFPLKEEVNIIKRGYRDDNTYVFTTDYQKLKKNDLVEVVQVPEVEDIDDITLVKEYDDTLSTNIKPYELTDDEIFKPVITSNDKVYTYNDIDIIPSISSSNKTITSVVTNVFECENDLEYDFTIGLSANPQTAKSIYKLLASDEIVIWKEYGSYRLPINISTSFSVNTQQSDLVNKLFFEEEKKKVINPIVDAERVRFEPYFKNSEGVLQPINSIKFALKFFDKKNKNNDKDEWDYLGFVDDDVKYRRMKLSNTFLRLNFFNEQSPTSQNLEFYSTLFVDVNMMYSDYTNGLKNITGFDPNYFYSTSYGQQEPNRLEKLKTSFYVYNPNIKQIKRDSKRGLNYIYSNSSEGYYIYLFGNEYKDSIPSELYMKAEFNNARDGKRTLFFNRKNADGVELDNIFFDKKTPNSLNYAYVKFIAVYNQELKKYIYYPDDKYVGNNMVTLNGDEMIINLYEANVK